MEDADGIYSGQSHHFGLNIQNNTYTVDLRRGLFCMYNLFRYQLIAIYRGELISNEEMNIRIINGHGGYQIDLEEENMEYDESILDCYNNAINGHLPFCFASMANCIFNAINTTTRTPAVENAFIEVIYDNNGDPIGAGLYALTDIIANTEIMIDYGEDYVYGENG
jgi:hypothetical protein